MVSFESILNQTSSTIMKRLNTIENAEERNKRILRHLPAQISELSDTAAELELRMTNLEQNVNRQLNATHLLVQSVSSDLGSELISAVTKGDLQHVVRLIKYGADIEYEDSNKNRPIHLAVQNRHPCVLEVLLKNGANIDSPEQCQRTALHLVALSRSLECGRILLEQGAGLENRDQWRKTPVIFSAITGFNEFVELLLLVGANVNASQENGWTGLHFAANEGPLSTVKLLVNNGADVRLKDVHGKTALDLAVDRNHHEIIDFLQNLGNYS